MILLISVAFIGGLLLGGYTGFSLNSWVAWLGFGLIAVSAISGILGLWLRRRSWIIPALVLVLVIGFARGGGVETDPSVGWVGVPANGTKIVAQGVLLQDATRSSSNDFLLRLSVDRVLKQNSGTLEFENVNFLLFVYTERISADSGRIFDEFKYGDRYEVSGTFQVAEAGFDFTGSLNSQISTLVDASNGNFIRRNLASVREAISQQLTVIVPDDISGLAAAMTVGDRKRLSSDVTNAFRSSGLAHLLAISGFHISLIGGAVLGLAILILGRRFGLYIITALVAVWVYAALAGLSPSVTRAAIMFSVFLVARLLGRQNGILPAIGLAAVVMVLISPEIITTISFQLSFAAVLGITLLTTQLNRLWHHFISPEASQGNVFLRIVNYTVIGLSASLGATLFTAPIVIAVFGQTALAGPITTLIVAPVLPFFIFPLLSATVLSWIWEPLGSIIAFPAVLSGEYMTTVASSFASVEWLIVQYDNLPIYISLAWYAVLGLVVFHRPLLHGIKLALSYASSPAVKRYPVLIAVAIMLIFSWGAVATFQDDNLLKIYFPQTSVGDLIVIETPSGFQMIVDGARRRDEAVQALGEILPFWDNSIDMVVLTHHDADHLGGLAAVIDRYAVSYILDSNAVHDSLLAQEWNSKLNDIMADGNIVVQKAVDGMTIDTGDGVIFEVLWSGFPTSGAPINDYSTVIRLTYGKFSVLLTGDITSAVEDLLAKTEDDLQSTLLKVAHHGSTTSSSATFLEAVKPLVAVIQAGNSNPFGHPNNTVVKRIESFLPPASPDAPRLLVTKDTGDIGIFSNGDNILIELIPNTEQ